MGVSVGLGCSCVLFFELHSEESGRCSVESIVRTLVIVAFHPFERKLADFIEGSEGVGIEDFFSEATIESLDVTVLHGSAGLDSKRSPKHRAYVFAMTAFIAVIVWIL